MFSLISKNQPILVRGIREFQYHRFLRQQKLELSVRRGTAVVVFNHQAIVFGRYSRTSQQLEPRRPSFFIREHRIARTKRHVHCAFPSRKRIPSI